MSAKHCIAHFWAAPEQEVYIGRILPDPPPRVVEFQTAGLGTYALVTFDLTKCGAGIAHYQLSSLAPESYRWRLMGGELAVEPDDPAAVYAAR